MFLTPDDLPTKTRGGLDAADLGILIEDAEARALAVAPCLGEEGRLTDQQQAQVKAIIRGAVMRAAERMGSDDRQMTSGPFSIGPAPSDSGNSARVLLWPTELEELSRVCSRRRGRAYVGWLG